MSLNLNGSDWISSFIFEWAHNDSTVREKSYLHKTSHLFSSTDYFNIHVIKYPKQHKIMFVNVIKNPK